LYLYIEVIRSLPVFTTVDGAKTDIASAGLYKLDPVDPELESACFQPCHL
jgi:hypothetical protein